MSILFREDWQSFPGAIADYKTENKSFLRLAEVYRKMGVQNNIFHLALLQPSLQGIDPFSPTLIEEEKLAIITECEYNPWYFLREVVRIPPVAGNKPISYKANRGNIALTWSFLSHIDFALIQPRQTGKSVSVDCLMTWLMFLRMVSSYINMITKDADLRKRNVDRLKIIRDLLPSYLLVSDRTDVRNQEALTYNTRGNRYSTAVAQSSESAAANIGRGTTAPITQIDEGPFIRHVGTTLPAALAAGTQARQEAKENGQPYGNLFTTTAGKKDDRDGKYMYDLIHNGAVWSERFLDARNEPELHQMVKANCLGIKTIINGTFSHRQLGKTDQWLYDAIATTNVSGDEADRDFFNRWTSGTQRSPLTPEQNDMIFNSEVDPDYEQVIDKQYIVRWYLPKEKIEKGLKTGHYVLGLDTSEAIGQDGIGLIIIDIRDLSVVGAASLNESNLILFGKFIAKLLITFPTLSFIVERKSTGIAIIDVLLLELPAQGIDPFRRMYNKVVDDSLSRKEDYKAIQLPLNKRNDDFYAKYKKDFGFVTNAQNRELLYGNVLQNAVKNAGHLVQDKVLSQEIRGLVTKNGRIDHTASGNDDTVIAWLLTHWFLTQAQQLSYYGIDPGQAMVLVGGDNTKMTEQDVELRAQREKTRLRIEEVVNALKEAEVGFKINKLERELRQLTKDTYSDGGEVLSFDALRESAKQERSQTKKQQRKIKRTPLKPIYQYF